MIAPVKKSTEQKMQKSLEALKNDLGKVRTGRAHTGCWITSRSTTTAIHGADQPGGQRHLIDARTIGVTPWEKKMAAVIEKAIRDSDLGLNPRRWATWCGCRCRR
jgi:ribosome recycling factor